MKADADGNGVITRAEAETGAAARFAMMDADKNGQISRAEFMAHRHEGEPGGRMHGDKGMGHHKMGMGGHGRGGMMMDMSDANKDGNISQAEFTAAALSHFDQADANKDGQVSAEERKAMHEQMRAKRHEMKHDHSAT